MDDSDSIYCRLLAVRCKDIWRWESRKSTLSLMDTDKKLFPSRVTLSYNGVIQLSFCTSDMNCFYNLCFIQSIIFTAHIPLYLGARQTVNHQLSSTARSHVSSSNRIVSPKGYKLHYALCQYFSASSNTHWFWLSLWQKSLDRGITQKFSKILDNSMHEPKPQIAKIWDHLTFLGSPVCIHLR